MPIPLITYEAIVALCGEDYAKIWFRPYSLIDRH